MAEGWASKLNLPSWHFFSGTIQAGKKDPLSVEAMREVNIDIKDKEPARLNSELLKEADVIVAIYDSRHESAPIKIFPAKEKVIQWNVPNPAYFQDFTEKWAAYQIVCDKLALKVRKLKEILK